jgi:hypothetical protein
MFEFSATVSARSSRGAGGPPGEKQVMELNPGRIECLRSATGWQQVEPGSLNLEVADGVIDQLSRFKLAMSESASDIQYPSPYQSIPVRRGGYRYYRAVLCVGEHRADVLLRRAVNPLPNRIEAFCSVNLRQALQVVDGDVVRCQLTE